ncbi:MAG: DUF3365 domain-containing protein [Verrucomicrobiae bacterium]|nr:DUF3365 domain-containing protein [Verrucomicrobiae bacterium]
MKRIWKLAVIFCMVVPIAVMVFAAQKQTVQPKKKLQVTIQPRHMADALYAVIHGHREVYLKLYSEKTELLSDPCSVFRKNSEAVASKGVEFSYVIRSLKPIAERNLPETEFEKKALESFTKNSNEPVCAEELLGGRWYFTAVYPEKATHRACVECHNKYGRDKTIKHNEGDVLGGIVIRVALEL